jgi:DNA-binding CsgD family transcriptional regulator
LSVLGSTLFFVGAQMSRQRKADPPLRDSLLAKPILTAEEWNRAVIALRLSPQQGRIIELILQAKRDKEIAAALDVNIWTVRTHLTRLFTRLGVADRVELILLVFAAVRNGQRTEDVMYQ